jgi:branched-subunit amino acid transport protein
VADATALILVVGMAAVTYLTRLPLAFLARRRARLPRAVDRVLEQIPVAAFAAIVFPAVLQPDGHTDLEASNLYLWAAVVTVAAAVAAPRSLIVPLTTGVATAVLLHLLLA